jgi:hypothetical protein
MDAFKLPTSYDTTGRSAAHKANRTKGINISPVAQHYYVWLRGKRTAGEIADDRRRADNRLFSATNKDAQWIDLQLSRIAFKDHWEGLPQRFRNMLRVDQIISDAKARDKSATPSKQTLHVEIEPFSSLTVLRA